MHGSEATGAASVASLPNSEYESGVLAWMNAALEEGLGVNRSQYNYDKIGATIDAIMGVDEPSVRSPRLSNSRLNRIQKIALEMRSMLTDIKPSWEYKANAKRFEKQAELFGKLAKHWYLARGIDQVFRDAIDYVLAAGTGYVHLFWNSELPGPSDMNGVPTQGDIDARAEDPRDVIIIRHSGDKRSLQGARGVIIRRERPTSSYKPLYGARAAGIKADRVGLEKESPSQKKARETQDAVLADAQGPHHHQLFGGAPANSAPGPVPVTDEFTAYITDFSVNKSGKAKEMGSFIDVVNADGQRVREPEYSWCYVVQPNERLYPFGRRIIFTRYGVLEDGPSRLHMGLLPVCKVTLDTWAWSMIGTSPLHPLLSIQRAVDENVRVIQNHIRRVGKPGMVYDKNAIGSTLARKLNMAEAGLKVGHNPHASGGKGAFSPLHEPPLDQTVPEWLKFLLESMDEMSGIAALKQFSQLGQLPSTETIDKIIESMTPLVRARSRSMEVFIRDFAMMLASIFMQHYTLDMRLRIFGADGMTAEDWNMKAGDLMPDFINDEDYDARGNVLPEALVRGVSPDYIRNREFLRFFSFNVAPGSLLDAATITKKLLYLQLSRMGLIDHWTMLEMLEIQNVGKPPDWATNITLRLQAERLMGLGVIASTVGRPPTAQSMPTMTSSGAISESG